jgi:hypothetical protein
VPKWKVITTRRTGSSHDSAGGFARWSRGIGRPLLIGLQAYKAGESLAVEKSPSDARGVMK